MRKRRLYSRTGFYHIVIRGNNKQNIFYKEVDKSVFIAYLRKYSRKLNIKVFSYCLMDNHVHLEIGDDDKKVSLFMQCLCSLYARYFNRKYDRIGHLFQERYLSEEIKDEKYFLAVLRYILQNPEKAGICKCSEYRWSSYKCYKSIITFVEKDLVTNYFGSVKFLYDYIESTSNQNFLELELRPSEKEKNYIERVMELLKSDTPLLIPDIPRNELNEKLQKLKAAKLSVRVISRVTGISKYLVQKA